MGGGFVLVLAAQQGDKIGAAVPFYGVLAEDYPRLSGLTAAVLGHFGEQDRFTTPAPARELAEQIETRAGATAGVPLLPGRATRSSTTRTCSAPTTPEQRQAGLERAPCEFLREQLGAPQAG